MDGGPPSQPAPQLPKTPSQNRDKDNISVKMYLTCQQQQFIFLTIFKGEIYYGKHTKWEKHSK